MKVLIPTSPDVTNPYARLLCKAYLDAGHSAIMDEHAFLQTTTAPDLLHIQWPEAIYKWGKSQPVSESTVQMFQKRLSWFKDQSTFIVYTVHNLEPHELENGSVERDIYEAILASADLILHHGESSIKLITDRHPQCKLANHLVVPHGPYDAGPKTTVDSRDKYRLPKEKWIILNFGFQRTYKGAGFVNEVFEALPQESFHLFTIGPRIPIGSGRLGQWIASLENTINNWLLQPLKRNSRKTTLWKKVPPNQVSGVMEGSDIVFLGHQSGINSGILSLAISHSRPVVFPDLGNFQNQAEDWPWSESYMPGDSIDAQRAIIRLAGRLSSYSPGHLKLDNIEWLKTNDWARQIAVIEENLGLIASSQIQ